MPDVGRDRALSTLMFTAELLRLTYEMQHLVDQPAGVAEPGS